MKRGGTTPPEGPYDRIKYQSITLLSSTLFTVAVTVYAVLEKNMAIHPDEMIMVFLIFTGAGLSVEVVIASVIASVKGARKGNNNG